MISIYIFIIAIICVLMCFAISQITNSICFFFFHCFNKYFPLCSKKTITEFVSCFIGSLVVKVIKNRLKALKKGAIRKGVCPWSNRDPLVIMVSRSDKDRKIVNSLRGTRPLRNFGQVTFTNLGLCSKVSGLHWSTKISCVQISMLCIGAD